MVRKQDGRSLPGSEFFWAVAGSGIQLVSALCPRARERVSICSPAEIRPLLGDQRAPSPYALTPALALISLLQNSSHPSELAASCPLWSPGSVPACVLGSRAGHCALLSPLGAETLPFSEGVRGTCAPPGTGCESCLGWLSNMIFWGPARSETLGLQGGSLCRVRVEVTVL